MADPNFTPYRSPATGDTPSEFLKKFGGVQGLSTSPYGAPSSNAAANSAQVDAQVQATPGLMGQTPLQGVAPHSGLTVEQQAKAVSKSSNSNTQKSNTSSSSNTMEEDKSKQENDNTGSHKEVGFAPTAVTQGADQDFLNLPQSKAAQAGISQLESQITGLHHLPIGQDYRPLMAALDSMINKNAGQRISNTAEATPGVPGVEARNQMISQYLQKLQTDKYQQQEAMNMYLRNAPKVTDTSGTAMKNIQDQITQMGQKQNQAATTINVNTNGQTNTKSAMEKAADPASGAGSMADVRRMTSFQGLVKQSLAKDTDAADNISKSITRLQEGSSIEDARNSILQAVADVGGRPNQAEVNMEGINRALLAKISNAFDVVETGKMSEDNRSLITQSLQTLAQLGDIRRQAKVRILNEQGTAFGIDPDRLQHAIPQEMRDYWKPVVSQGQQAQAKIQAATPGAGLGAGVGNTQNPIDTGANGLSAKDEARRQELLKKYGNK